MILMIDNYDSFTYNLVQYFQVLNQSISVYKHDEISISDIESMPIDAIVISPGPNAPKDAGISVPVIQHFYQKKPILGVCLGHQAISYAFGGKIISASEIKHGKTSLVQHSGKDLFNQLPNPTQVIRYHSLMVDPNSLADELQIDATTQDGTIMAISHQNFPLYGIQFHPESFLTTHGLDILRNFTNIIKKFKKDI